MRLKGSSRRPPTRNPHMVPLGPNGTSKIKVLVCTGNMGNQEPNDESISEWIPKDGATKPVLLNQQYPIKNNGKKNKSRSYLDNDNNGVDDKDENFHIIAIGMQEATFELGESSKSKLASALLKVANAVEQVTKDQKYEEKKHTNAFELLPGEKEERNRVDLDNGRDQDDTHLLHQMLGNHLPGYTRAVSYQRGQMRLMIFYNKDKISLDVISIKAQNTGRAGLANKGGIVAECDINSGTRISFLTAHLEAHEGLAKYNTRCSTIGDIFRGTTSSLTDSHCDVSMTSHFVFAIGDLNFRTRLPNHEIGSDEHLQKAHNLAERKDWDTLNKYDELSLALRKKECLVGFSTPYCDFPPTFKIERKDGYSYVSKRSPSYTDRILYKANHGLSQMIDLLAYEPIDRFTTSDHKPIRGAFDIQLNQKLTSRPLRMNMTKDRFRIVNSKFLRKLQKLRGTGYSRKNTKASVSTSKHGEADSENFHLFFSSIGCEIGEDAFSGLSHMPSPYVSFISTPSDAIKLAERRSTFIKDIIAPLATKWPRTESISNTFNPQWETEISFKIRTHLISGAPVDLTGAMLHILVHDTKDFHNSIGSCSLNLASLIIASTGKEISHDISTGTGKEQPTSIKRKLSKALAFRASRKNKAKNTAGARKPAIYAVNDLGKVEVSEAISENVSESIELSGKISVAGGSRNRLNEPKSHLFNEILMKNGKEVGRIKFIADSWWLSDNSFPEFCERKSNHKKKSKFSFRNFSQQTNLLESNQIT
mmetsp:Transcript_12793/g.26939  ORF Transcript_12793/g.26939 Transcript_12793/m.26939 type:complete len:762 (+) Transcript_12793:136-2421(+)